MIGNLAVKVFEIVSLFPLAQAGFSNFCHCLSFSVGVSHMLTISGQDIRIVWQTYFGSLFERIHGYWHIWRFFRRMDAQNISLRYPF
jgi:hypothetical protein